MKKILLLLITASIFSFTSCIEDTCGPQWDEDICYKRGDIVYHCGQCWIACWSGQGNPPGGLFVFQWDEYDYEDEH